MNTSGKGLISQYDDAWLLDGVRTPFAEYNSVLGLISPIDLGIKVARSRH
jgi:acetyl-CoA C-acetyltransferase